jgi:tetratricopeptide (TPR) repeat protein
MLPVGRLFPRGEGVTWLEEMASHLSEVKSDERAAEIRKLLLKAAPRQVAIAWIDFLMGRTSRRSVETDVAEAGNAQINNWHPKPRLDPSSLGVLNAQTPAARSQRKEHDELVTTVIVCFEGMLAADERKLGADHPNTLVSRSSLAGLYQAAGRTAEAISLLERTLGDRERVLGAYHLDTLRSRYDLARAYQAAGRTGEAISLLERTLADCKRLPRAAHPPTKMVRKNLAVLTGKPMHRRGS